jgi:hypothetical protein
MGNSGSTAIDYLMGKDSRDKHYDEKLPDGDKYFGLVNVSKFIRYLRYEKYRTVTFAMRIQLFKYFFIANSLGKKS